MFRGWVRENLTGYGVTWGKANRFLVKTGIFLGAVNLRTAGKIGPPVRDACVM